MFALIDPPNPFSPTKSWIAFRDKMQAQLGQLKEAPQMLALANQELERRSRLPAKTQKALDR